jgi:YfiH family protein
VTHPLFHSRVAGRDVTVVATDRRDGDVHPRHVEVADLRQRQVAATGRHWVMAHQVHGLDVVETRRADVLHDAEPVAGTGDVLVTHGQDLHVAVWTADCAPLVLIVDDGTVVGAHGGWRGLAAGVIDVAVDAAVAEGGRVSAAVLGPTIRPCCYAFGPELHDVAVGVHADEREITGTTSDGQHALDVPAAIAAGLRHRGVELDVVGPCTGCDDRWFSHRTRSDRGRQATVAMVGT